MNNNKKTIRIKCPAKINLTLEVLDKREDGFHNIKSIMQTIDLYDVLTINAQESEENSIALSGTYDKIPYDSRNLVYKAVIKFLEKTGIKNQQITIHLEKNIPVEAGLAGGSTDAAGTFYGLNEIFNKHLTSTELEELCSSLGSDLNFCLNGGTALCTGRGEVIEKLPPLKLELSLIKPKDFGISAKEAYTKCSMIKARKVPNNTEKMIELLNSGDFDEKLLYNSLENAVIGDYSKLQEIKTALPTSLMSGSGSTFFVLNKKVQADFDEKEFLVIENLKSIDTGVEMESQKIINPSMQNQ